MQLVVCKQEVIIFGENIDVSLYYMLEENRLYKKYILNFLNELPLSFIENISHDYNYNVNIMDIDETDDFHNIQSDKFDDVSYRFYFNCKSLNIFKFKNGKAVFSLIIEPTYPHYLKSMKEESSRYIGSIGFGEYPKLNFIEIDYNLHKSKNSYKVTHQYVLLRNLIETPRSISKKVKNNFTDISLENYFVKKLTKR